MNKEISKEKDNHSKIVKKRRYDRFKNVANCKECKKKKLGISCHYLPGFDENKSYCSYFVREYDKFT